MSLLTNVNKVNFTSRYDIDKVIYKTGGSRSVPQASFMSDSILITIPHTLGYAPLCIGQYSETSNFSVAYEFGSSPQVYNPTYMQFLPRISAVVESDGSNIYVRMINFDTTRTLYYRVVGLIPSGITSSPKLDISLRDSLMFNGQDNFLKILKDGKETRNLSVTSPQTWTIYHGLGYRPTALVFTEDTGVIRRSGAENVTGISGISSIAYVDTANLYVEVDSFGNPAATVHYRIYLDN